MNTIRICKNARRSNFGLEYNYEVFQRHDSATCFIRACMDILFDQTLFPSGLWVHKSGREGFGYQFFQFWGDDAENQVERAAQLISDRLGINMACA